MTSDKIKLLSAVAAAVLMASPALAASTVHKGKVSRPDAASSSDAYASQSQPQRPYDANTVVGWDGQVLGSDPDPNIRFQLMRDQNLGGD
jgi:hypothetical protein